LGKAITGVDHRVKAAKAVIAMILRILTLLSGFAALLVQPTLEPELVRPDRF
jgi:hypothetical protein